MSCPELTRKVDQLGLVARVEQVPDRDSRIRLTKRRDRLGLPIVEIDGGSVARRGRS